MAASATKSDVAAPVESETTTHCELTGASIERVATCDAAPQSKTTPLPLRGGNGERPRVTTADLSGDTLYAGFEVTSCVPRSCATSAGVFRSTGGQPFEEVIQHESKVLLAKQTVASATRAMGTTSARTYVSGTVTLPGSLLALSTSEGLEKTVLERRKIGSDGRLGPADPLLQIRGVASGLKTNGRLIAWTEPTTLVVAEPSGKQRHGAALPPDTAYRVLDMTDRFAFAMFERELASGGWSYSICALNLETGRAEVVVPPRARIVDMAANSTHLFWIESSDAESYQVWAQPLAGGPARTLACERESIDDIEASDEAVYWIANEVHRIDARSI